MPLPSSAAARIRTNELQNPPPAFDPDALADEIVKGAPAPKDAPPAAFDPDALADEIVTGKAPATPLAQALNPQPPAIVAPTDLTARGQKLWGDLYQQRLYQGHTEEDASAYATDQLSGILLQRSATDNTAFLNGPLGINTALREVRAGTDPSGLTHHAAEAFGPHYFNEDTQARRNLPTPEWKIASTPSERRAAANNWAADHIQAYRQSGGKAGLAPDVAAAKANEQFENNEPLLLPNASNPTTAVAQTDTHTDVALSSSVKQALTDVQRGVSKHTSDLANLAKDAIIDPFAYLGENVANAETEAGLPVAESAAKGLQAFRTYNLPDPLDAAAGYLGSIPDAPAPVRDWVHRIRLAQERDAGVLQGSVEIANQALPASWKIDPNDDGFINAVARIVVATPQHDQAPEPVTAELVAGTVLNSTTEAAKAVPRELRDLYTMNPSMSDATGRQAQNAASLMRAVSDPMQLVFQGVSTTPTGQESSIGQILRVVGSLSQGLVTTYVGRIADKTLTSLGAESYRQHRVPGQGGPEYEAPSWVETVVPLFNLGDFTHDYLTTIENGDGFTTETMHALDTVAYGTDWLSPEWLAEVRQGGRINNLLVTTATFADLLLPVDGLPGEALKHTAGAGSRFYDGYAMGRNANMERGQAAVLGAAHVYPWFTDKALSGDAAYVSGRTLAGDAGRQQMQDVRADAVARGDQKQVVAIDRALSGVDRDAPTVASAVLYRWWQKEVRSGRDPMASFSKTFAGTAIGQRMREMFTTLGVTAPAAPGGSPVEAVVRPLTAPLTDPTAKTLVSMGYTADQLAGMTEAVGRRRVLEAVRPGESFTDTLAPEQSPARHAVVDYARSASDLARLEGHAPVGALPDELASTDPADADARGRILAHLAGEWNAPLGMAMAALQSALSYVDGNTGRTVRAPWPDPQGLASVSAKHMARAVNYLLRASPEQVWRNVEAFERGEPYRWINDIRAEEEANQWSRRIGPGPSDRAVLSILPPDHALREAMVGERQGEGKNRYQELARAGRDHLAALVDTQRAFRDTLKKATETARTAYSRAAHAANLDPVVPAGADIISSLRDLSARLTDPKVTAALVKNAEKVEQARAALRGMDERLGVAIRWLDARMRDARPPTTVDMAKLPGRVEVRKALRERAKAGGFTPEQVDVWLVVQDRIAQALVRLGVIEKADEWYRMHSFEDLAEGTTADATDVLRQEALPPMTAKELRERLARTNFIPTSRVLEILGDQRPEYLDAVAQFILEQREKVRAGLLTNRDVAKAYIMATASQGSGAMDARAVEQVIGSPLAPEFTVTSKRGQRLVRPEEAMAAWLFSPMGQRALDGIERGVFDEEAWQSAARVRKAFGDDRINNLNVLGDPKKGAANMRNIATVTAALNAAGGDWKKVEAAVTKLNGVATGKSPFIGHLLGFGEMPTLDAREINGWLTGRGDIGALTTDRANLARAFSGGINSAPLARSFMEKIQDRFLALRKKGAPGTDLAPEVFGAIMHHWLWDKLGGTETTHEGLYKAMRFAQDTVSSPKGEIDLTSFAKTGQAIIRLAADADLSTLVHESAHLLRRILPAEHMRDVDAYVHERFGGWNIEAEEWFARQMEAVLQTGRMVVDIRDPVKAPGFLARINTALRIVAEVLTDIYKSGKLPDVSPVFKGWVEKFLDLHDEGELPPLETERRVHPTDVVPEGAPPSTEEARARRAAEDEARHRQQAADRLALEQVYPAMVKAVEDAATGRKWEPAPDMKPATREPVVRAAPTGWTMDSTRTALETVAGMAPGTDRRKFVHSQILPKIAKWLGLTKEETKAYDQRVSASKDTPDGDLAVLREMAARGGMEAAAPAPAVEVPSAVPAFASADAIVAAMKRPNRLRLTELTEPLAVDVAGALAERSGKARPADFLAAAAYLRDLHPRVYQEFIAFRAAVDTIGADVLKKGAPATEMALAAERRTANARTAVDEFVRGALPAPKTPVAEPVGEPVLGPSPKRQSSEAPLVIATFRTAKNSIYMVLEDGTTVRTKAPRPEHPGDSGIKERSHVTFYVTPADRDKLGIFQSIGGPVHDRRVVVSGSEAAVVGTDKAGKSVGLATSRVPIRMSPEVGLYPVETWDNGQTVHFGNQIVDVTQHVAPEAPSPAPEPPRTIIDRSEEIHALADELVARMDAPDRAKAKTRGERLATLVARSVMEHRGEVPPAKMGVPEAKQYLADTFGPAAYNDFASALQKAMVEHRAPKTATPDVHAQMDAARQEAARKATDLFLRKTVGAGEPPPTTRLYPPDIAHAVKAEPEPVTLPPGMPETVLVKPVSVVGTAELDFRGRPRVQYDSKGESYHVAIRMEDARDVLPSHTLSGAETPGYDQRFQNREHGPERAAKLEESSRSNDVVRTLDPHQITPTNGASVFWRDPETGIKHILSGNGRDIRRRWVVERAALPEYQPLAAALHAEIAAIASTYGLGTPQPYHSIYLELVGATREQALNFARRSQEVEAAAQRPVAEVSGAARTFRALSDAKLEIDINTIPAVLTKENIQAFVAANRNSFWSFLALDTPDIQARSDLFQIGGEPLLKAASAALLSMVDDASERRITRYGQEAASLLATVAPILVTVRQFVAEKPELHPYDVSTYFADAMELWQRAQIEGNTSPETMSAMAERLHGQRSLTSATPLAVSQMSLLLAMAFAQKSTERGVGGLMRELSQAAEKGMRPSLFGRATDHVGIALRVLAGDTKNLDTIRTFAPQIPAVHADAIEIARQKGVQSVVAVEALRTADNPIPTEPQGHADVVGLFPKGDVLSQNRAYTEAVTTSGPNDPLVKDPWVRDHSVRAPAAIATRSGETNPAGVILSEYRGKPLLDRRQLNLALGYKGDQMTYTAADVGARVFAHAVVSILQNQEHRDAYVRTEGRVAVPLRRAAAVRGRALALLGDLPKSIRENIWTLADVRDPATGAVTSTIRERRQVQASDPHDAREVVRLPPESAHRVRLLLDSLETSGWWDSLPTSVRFLTLDDLMHGEDPARPGSRDFTTEHFRAIVGALQDAQSGVAPFRGRAERFNIASHLIWYHTRRPGGSLTPPPLPRDASLFEKATYTARSTLGGLVLNAANYVLPWDQYQRDMPEPMRPAYEEFRREVGRLPGDFVQKYEAVLETMRKGNPTALLDAFRQMVHTRAMDGFDPPISVDASQGASLLQRLRGWIYEDVDPRTPNAPYVRQGQISAHDRARSAPITLAEILAHRDLVDAVLRGTHDMDGTVAELLTQLRAGTIQADGAAYLLGHVYAKLGAAEKMGEDILVAAAGESGAEDATIQKLKNSNLSGLALDAYEAFFMGEWEKPTANVPDRSVAHLVGVGLGVGRVVDTPRWVAEVMMKQATAAAYDRFIQRVIDERYVLDLREIYRLTTDPGATVPTLPVLVHFGQDVRKAVTQILNGQDYALYEARDVTGRTYYGRDNATGISSEARAAAHAMIGRMGLRPDVSAVRASIKGELIPSILDTRYDAAVQKAMGNPDEILRLISEDVRGARPASVDISYSGRDDLLGTILTAEIRDLIRAQSPVGKNLAGILSHRSALEKLALTVKEYNSQMKGQLITGGPNGWAATAMAMSALAGGATAAGVGATFLGVHALGYLPRLAAYTNQVVDAFFQHWMGTGAKLMARTFTDPTIMRLSAAGMAHSLRLHRIARPLEIAMRAVSSRVNSANDRTCFTTASGAVWSVHDLVQFAERNALDGTQARFESGEGAQRAIDRMIREYGPSTQTGRLLQTVMGFYGRHKLAENYRKVYEGVDTYFRYAVLTRGLMDGMNPHDAIQLSLRTNFDFSAVAPLDRTVGRAFLFWMAQRRMIDLTLATLIEHPTRVLGPIRFARMQNLVANIEDDTEDHNVVAETVSDEGAYAPALTYLPVGNANQAAFKVILQEPAQVKAMRFMDMLFSADPALVGQMHPFVGLGYNVLSASFGGSYIDFFKRRVVTGDQNWKVYPSFVMFNQRLNGGSINDQFSFVPVAQPDGSWVFEVSGGNVGHLKFDALRQAVPGVSTWMSQMNQYDAAGGPQEAFVNDLSRLMQMIDPHVAGDPLTVTMGGGRAIVPADKAVRPALGSWWESVAPLGVKFVPVDTVRLARERPAIQAAKAIEAKQKETPTVLPAPGKPASLGPEVPNPATTLETVQPGKGMGL